jgi:hypothetical protein
MLAFVALPIPAVIFAPSHRYHGQVSTSFQPAVMRSVRPADSWASALAGLPK